VCKCVCLCVCVYVCACACVCVYVCLHSTTLQCTAATLCNILQHTATHCNTLQHIHTCTSCQWRENINRDICHDVNCVLQCSVVCCSVLQCVAACCSVLQRVAVCCNVCCSVFNVHVAVELDIQHTALQRVAVCCSVSQCVAVCCSVLQRAQFLRCSVLNVTYNTLRQITAH